MLGQLKSEPKPVEFEAFDVGGGGGPSEGCTRTQPGSLKAYWNASPVPPKNIYFMFMEDFNEGDMCPPQAIVASVSVKVGTWPVSSIKGAPSATTATMP